jgi:hypothetical protein
MPTLGTTTSGGEIKMRRALPERAGMVPAEIILCHLPHNDITPLVTWQANVEDSFKGTQWEAYWGHYFKAGEEAEAVADFLKR